MFSSLATRFSQIFTKLTGQAQLTEKNMQEVFFTLETTLVDADVPHSVVKTFIEQIRQEALGQQVYASLKPGQQVVKIVHDRLVSLLGGKDSSTIAFHIPSTIMVMGLQGSGKTTTLGKLAHYLISQARERGKTRTVLLASVDFYRPAAIEQLEKVAQGAGASFFRALATDVLAAAREIQTYARHHAYDFLLLDTAGRLHVDQQMLQELKNIQRVLEPKYRLLVLDAMTGQESLAVATAFDTAVGITGAIMTKLDSQTRAGALVGFRAVVQKPVLFVGTGEKSEDIELFRPERMAQRILGMGDVLSLVEKAQRTMQNQDQESLTQALKDGFAKGGFTLDDFAQQLAMVSKLGSLSSVARYLPGLGGQISDATIAQGEQEMKKFRAIISSMTAKERCMPRILNGSRKQRIARGSGTQVSEVNTLLVRFEQSQQCVKLFKQLGRFEV